MNNKMKLHLAIAAAVVGFLVLTAGLVMVWTSTAATGGLVMLAGAAIYMPARRAIRDARAA